MRPESESSSTPMKCIPSGGRAEEVAASRTPARAPSRPAARRGGRGPRTSPGRRRRRGVEGVEHGALGHSRTLGGEERDELLAEGLPGGALVGPVTGSGKSERATAPNPPKRASVCRSARSARRPSRSTVMSVRMASRYPAPLALSLVAVASGGRGWDSRSGFPVPGGRLGVRGRTGGGRGSECERGVLPGGDSPLPEALGARCCVEERKERLRRVEPSPGRLDACLVQLVPASATGRALGRGHLGREEWPPSRNGPAGIELEFRLGGAVGADEPFAVLDDSVGDLAATSRDSREELPLPTGREAGRGAVVLGPGLRFGQHGRTMPRHFQGSKGADKFYEVIKEELAFNSRETLKRGVDDAAFRQALLARVD